MVRPERFELPTAWFVARYSIQLSYGRNSRWGIIQTPALSVKRHQAKYGGERGIRTLDGAFDPILP